MELTAGTFLRAGGTGGTTKSGTATDGGSNTHSHSLVNAVAEITITDDGGNPGIKLHAVEPYNGTAEWFIPCKDYGYKYDPPHKLVDGVAVTGSTNTINNEPIYKNVHIWRKIS